LKDVNNAFRAPGEQFQPGGSPSFLNNLLPSSVAEVLPFLFPTSVPSVPPLAVELMTERHTAPLRYRETLRYVKHRLALIGDAAHVVHPLAGQGVNLGIVDASVLFDVIHQALYTGHDIGDIGVLSNYENEQLSANKRMMYGIDFLHHMFKGADGPVAALRNLGLYTFNSISWLKSQSGRMAMGL